MKHGNMHLVTGQDNPQVASSVAYDSFQKYFPAERRCSRMLPEMKGCAESQMLIM